jgi:hypothetical protein
VLCWMSTSGGLLFLPSVCFFYKYPNTLERFTGLKGILHF